MRLEILEVKLTDGATRARFHALILAGRYDSLRLGPSASPAVRRQARSRTRVLHGLVAGRWPVRGLERQGPPSG
jgi:hypothetical protein